MSSGLVGWSGFVGSTLLRQQKFDHLYRSTDIQSIRGCSFDSLICAGAPAQKWKANKDPEGDLRSIQELISHLELVTCDRFVLISTVDVFPKPVDVDENSEVAAHTEAYGANRRLLEQFVAAHFKDACIVRLPGLVGPGLRKNVIFDFLNHNNLGAIESRAIFQFYPMVNLSADIQLAQRNGIKLIHLTAEPIAAADVAAEGFGLTFENHVTTTPVRYNLQTLYAGLFGGSGGYQYSRRETLLAIRAYAQSEQRSLKEAG